MRTDRDDFVYVEIEGEDMSVVKIGHGLDPLKRQAQQQTGNSKQLRVIMTLLGGAVLEKEIKQRFSEYRIMKGGTEWFRVSPDQDTM
jgi:hypothetical protein